MSYYSVLLSWVDASGHFSKRQTHVFYTKTCICLLHNVTGTVWHNALPCYSHASRIGSSTDSNSKSNNSSLSRNGTSSSDKSGNSQQCRVAVCTLRCNKGIKIWSLLWPEVRASSTSHQLVMYACSTSLLSCICTFLYVGCRYANWAMHVQPVHVTLGAPWCHSCCLKACCASSACSKHFIK
jgi:hypothetical protein